MADSIDTLLDYIVQRYTVPDELVDIDLTAQASEDGAEIEAEKRDALQREAAFANRLRGPFREGLIEAYRLGDAELALDDRDRQQNDMADALIRYLVGFDLAESRTQQTDPQHYIYYVSVTWDRLREVANAAGVDLDRALQSA